MADSEGNRSSNNGESSSSGHRWRFDIDLNFDPRWFVPSTSTPRQIPSLAMINEWVRNPSGTGETPPITSRPIQHLTRPRPPRENLHVEPGTREEGELLQPIPPPRESYVVNVESPEWETSEVPNVQRQESPERENPTEPENRSPADIIRQSPEGRAFLSVVERYSPFLFILFIKGLVDHSSGILCFLALLVTFCHGNSQLKKEVGKQRKRSFIFLGMILVNLVVCAAFIYYLFLDQHIYRAMFFLSTALELNSIWTLFWIISVSDYVAKFVTIGVKALVLALPAHISPFQKRGKYYLFIEHCSQLYRSLLPLHPWLSFLVNSYEGGSYLFGLVLAFLYALFKGTDIMHRTVAWRTALKKMLQNVHYGNVPSSEEMDECGAVCPICHDAFSNPTKLTCTHIFCEECVSTWFDRERTCPMCRAKVVDDPSYRDGSTSHFIQLF